MPSITSHCIAGLFIRISLIIYSEIQDNVSLVQYTDIDYRVFTDAARHMIAGGSPYERHTYRYTPLLAAVLIPNILLHSAWGKLLFSLVDLGVGLLIHRLVLSQAGSESLATQCAATWLYNPLAIVIATRGNADSISAFLVLLTVLLLQEQRSTVLVGAVHALAIHVRLYPIVFSLPLYLALQSPKEYQDRYENTRSSRLGKIISYLKPNRDQITLVFSCILTLFVLTLGFYQCYGYKFLHESFLYHLSRNDFRHNFSVYFYLIYLNSEVPPGFWQKVLTFLPQIVLLLVFSIKYGNRRHLSFCILVQAIVVVAYNPVLTSQYFVWFVSLIPPCIPQLKLSARQSGMLGLLWFVAQLAWLLPAYWLEFRGRNTFIYVWIQGIAFFCANMAVLARLIRSYAFENENDNVHICKKVN